MTRVLLLAAALGFGLSSASACDFHRSAGLDHTVVASVAEDPQSTPVTTPLPTDERAPDQAVPADQAE